MFVLLTSRHGTVSHPSYIHGHVRDRPLTFHLPFSQTGTPKFWGVEGDPNRPQYVTPGISPGHEVVGTIVEGDSDSLKVKNVTLGDRVTVEQIVPW